MNRDFLNREAFKDLHLTNFYWFKKGFAPEQVELIKKIGDNLTKEEGTILQENSSNEKIRKSTVSWLEENQQTSWIYDALYQFSCIANDKVWKFNLSNFFESIQYTAYEAPSSHYDWHLDIDGAGSTPAVSRKISIVVNLTDPKEYEGGELILKMGTSEVSLKEGEGSVILFPSYVLHKVNPVTKGKRNSLVLWVSGPPFS